MTKFKLLAAAAVVTSLAASPVMAKDTSHHSDKKTVKVHKAGKQARTQTWRNDRAADVQYDRGYDRQGIYDRGYDNSGFWPAEVAAGVVGGAVNTAGAIATAPFRNTYAYDNSFDDGYASAPRPVYRSNWDNGYNSNWNDSWARGSPCRKAASSARPVRRIPTATATRSFVSNLRRGIIEKATLAGRLFS